MVAIAANELGAPGASIPHYGWLPELHLDRDPVIKGVPDQQ
jgi:hypothetical protein